MPMRFRPRFSVRTLAVFVTLVCFYFGSWEATKRNSIRATRLIPEHVTPNTTSTYVDCPAPFIYAHHENGENAGKSYRRTRYYLFLFGPPIELPFQS
jgi:hypothetical protein